MILGGAGLLWIAGLAYFSLRRIVPHAGPGTQLHRIEHMAAFGVLGLLLLVVCRTRVQEWLAVLAIVCLALALEDGQHLLFKNVTFEWWDVRDDIIGLLFAWLLIRSWPRKLV